VAAVVAEIRRLRAGRSTEVLVTDYWNVFVDGQVGAALGPQYQALSDRVTRQANSAICAGAVQGGGVCVDLYAPFKGDGSQDPTSLLADDGDHPDADGHRTIAEALAAHGWHELGGAP
jgi:lysophospholipase L1-like esterase